jgi:hypothetical protein
MQTAGRKQMELKCHQRIRTSDQAIPAHETWILERLDAKVVSAALTGPAKPGPHLARTAKRYKKRFQQQRASVVRHTDRLLFLAA